LEIAVRRIVLFPALLLLASIALTASPGAAWPLDHLYSKDDIGQNKIPNVGTSHILVVPVNVGPIPFPPGQLTGLQTYFDPDGGPASFRRKWQAISRGVYDPIATVVDPVEYPDSCPFPAWSGKTVDDCEFKFDQSELNLILGGGVAEAFVDILGRVRDEQNIDLAYFDINTKDGPGSDGYFDGVIFITNIADGVAPPLEELFNKTVVASAPGGTGPMIEMGQVALAPPNDHEFAHLFGFIDLYGGPTVGGLMGTPSAGGLCAFSRQQIGWGETGMVTGYGDVELAPVLDSGAILRVGEGPSYMLIENRSGPLHLDYEVVDPGLWIYAIDETALTPKALHFFDLQTGDLYLPNKKAPYLAIAMPLDCDIEAHAPDACALDSIGDRRVLRHANGTKYGMGVEIIDVKADSTMTLRFYDPTVPVGVGGGGGGPNLEAPLSSKGGCDCGVGSKSGHDAAWAALAMLAVGLWRRRGVPRRRVSPEGEQRLP
jgi:MYXO-CTERM domain-containing protein